jgi:cytidine deaminase
MTDRPTTNSSRHDIVFTELDSFLDEDLPLEEAAVVADHVIGCQMCRQRLVELRGVERIFMLFLGETRDQG